jgi:hypothetical protein
MNIAPRVMATMRTVVKMEARTIFIRLARHIEAAERRIAQLGKKQNAQRGKNGSLEYQRIRLGASSKRVEV